MALTESELGQRRERDLHHILVLTVIFVGGGCALFCGFAWCQTNDGMRAAVGIVGRGLLTGLAFLLVGFVFGFLFGIPRALQQEKAGLPAANAEAAPSYQTNTNLEQISDWLTKILVGVGLSQLNSIPGKLRSLAQIFGTSLGSFGDVVALSLILYFLACGFLASYLWTRLYLKGAFGRADGAGDSALKAFARTPTDIDSQGKPQAAGVVDSVAADSLAQQPLAAMITPAQIVAWAKSKLLSGDYHDAVMAYELAMRSMANDPVVVQDYAVALSNDGEPQKAIRVLETVVDSPSVDRDLKRRMVQSLMYSYLYLDPPTGFAGAIRHGEAYVADRNSTPNAQIWVFLAAAYGQKHAWLKTHSAPQAELDDLRVRAVNAAKKALEVDPSFGVLLSSLYNAAADDSENDLATLRPDPDLDKLLGQS